MIERSLYLVLEVGEGTGPAEILRAYRKLTRRHHPEVNPGDELARERYQAVCEAFRILGDAALRAEYDRLGHDLFFRNRPVRERASAMAAEAGLPPGLVPDGFIAELLGVSTGPAVSRKGENVQHVLHLGFLEAARGTVSELQVTRKAACSRCEGAGSEPGWRMTCPSCGGEGVTVLRQGPLSVRRPCAICGAAGYRATAACPGCAGTGVVGATERVAVRTPAGVANGSEVRVRGKGHAGLRGGTPGDLVVIIRVAEHPSFTRKGDSIYSVLEIKPWDVALGGAVSLETLDGELPLQLSPGTRNGDEIRLSRRGIANPHTGRRGDHVVQIRVVVPVPVGEEGRRAYRELARALENEASGRKK